MLTTLYMETRFWLEQLWGRADTMGFWELLGSLPLFVQLEFGLNVLVVTGVAIWWLRKRFGLDRPPAGFHPGVTCSITCYSEGKDVILTIKSLALQLYNGPIEIIPVLDGSHQNHFTWECVLSQAKWVNATKNRSLVPIGKPQRGGRVSSLNTGLARAKYGIIMVFDGDTSLTNDTVRLCARHFADPNVMAVSGNLRVRNFTASLTSRMQALEYDLGIALGRTGLAEWGVINNISGAFGCFRKSLLQHIGGWDSGTAEDLDLTTRIKGYFGRHPNMKIHFEPHAIGFTDGPTTFMQLVKQRERWDGDLSYIYLRKFRQSFNPRILGWKNFLLYLLVGLVFQMAVPFLVWIYYIRMFTTYPVPFVLAVSLYVYLGYLLMSIFMWTFYMLTVTRFVQEDMDTFWLLPLQPLYSFTLRLLMVPYTLKSLIFKGHLDSAMAPYWVLKKREAQ